MVKLYAVATLRYDDRTTQSLSSFSFRLWSCIPTRTYQSACKGCRCFLHHLLDCPFLGLHVTAAVLSVWLLWDTNCSRLLSLLIGSPLSVPLTVFLCLSESCDVVTSSLDLFASYCCCCCSFSRCTTSPPLCRGRQGLYAFLTSLCRLATNTPLNRPFTAIR